MHRSRIWRHSPFPRRLFFIFNIRFYLASGFSLNTSHNIERPPQAAQQVKMFTQLPTIRIRIRICIRAVELRKVLGYGRNQ